MNSAFVQYHLLWRYTRGELDSIQTQTTNLRNLDFNAFLSLTIGFPPLAEQHRIVEKIETLLARVEASRVRLRRSLAIAGRLRQSIVLSACAGALSESWRSEHVEKTQREWTPARLGHVFKVATGATPLRNNSSYYENGDVPWVKSGAVNREPIMQADELITRLALKETNAKIFPPGTLVVAMYGEGATRGKVAELGIAAATNQALAAILFTENTESMRPFLKLVLRNRYIQSREDSAGGVQPNLSLQMIRDIEFMMPSAAEQREIIRRVDSLLALTDTIERRVSSALARADKLTQSILAKAFAGELVPTEAELAQREGRDYEPASVLIDRIRKEHPVGKKSARSSRRPRSRG
jgi:type I restriction enzyme S subunit